MQKDVYFGSCYQTMCFTTVTVFVILLTVISVTVTKETNLTTTTESNEDGATGHCPESRRCDNGMCYRELDLCDGWKDCSDGSDENPDVCQEAPDITKFECYNGHVIDISQVCDGIADCKDKADEDDAICYDPLAKNCTVPNSSALLVQCEFKGIPIPCEYEVRAWANIKIFCNIGYVPKNSYEWVDTNKCRSSGKWIHKIPQCTFNCGIPEDGKYPWNMIVYERKRLGFFRTCLGTLITPIHILTDYKCTHNLALGESFLEERIKVGLGQLGSESYYLRFDEPHSLIDVVSIELINRRGQYEHKGNDHEQDPNEKDTKLVYSYKDNAFLLTVLSIKSHIDLNEYRPACFDLDGKLNVVSNTTGQAVWFNQQKLSSSRYKFKFGDMRILPHDDCQKYLEKNKYQNEDSLDTGPPKLRSYEFCAIYDHCGQNCTEERLPEIQGGSGLFVNMNGKYYLYGGFVGIIKKQEKNGEGENVLQVYVFSDVRVKTISTDIEGKSGIPRNIAEEKIIDSSYLSRRTHYGNTSTCSVPFTHGGVYRAEPCLIENRPCSELRTHNRMEDNSIIYIYCNKNYKLKGSCNYMQCENKVWLPKGVTCMRLCDPLVTSRYVKPECSYEGKNVSCAEKAMAETVATSTCDSAGLIKDLTTYNNTCLHSGNWRDSPEVIEILCIDLCGILKTERPLVQDGEEANSTYHPWNAGLYFSYKEGHYVHICGGTLISKFAVLSAAHCLQAGNGFRLGAEVLKIGLGKSYRKYNHPMDTQAQYIQVENVYVPNLYDGPPSAYVADIAIVELKSPAILNDLVVPACIDTANKFFLNHNYTGSVVGWGYNGTDKYAKPTETLIRADLPYSSRLLCQKMTKKELNITLKLTIDKFCAFHFKDGKPIVRRGDSGSGITFKFEGRHYVYGLVSVQANNITSMFTNITYPDHLEFINRVLNQILDNKKNIDEN